MVSTKFIVIVLSAILVFVSACSAEVTPLPQSTNTQIPAITLTPTITKTITSTPTLTVTPYPSPMPSPTEEPPVRQTNVEIVTTGAVTGDGGNSWGGHQTRIVQTQDGVFTAYTVEGGGYLKREWRLVLRQDNGTWAILAQGDSGREPVNLLASPDGTLYIVGWPNGRATLWSGKPDNGMLVMTITKIPNELKGDWPYNSAGIDENGDLCVLSSEGGEGPGGWFHIACYLSTEGKWVTKTIPLDYRFCYTYVFPAPGGQLSFVSTRDVRWEALGYQKPPGNFDYVYNAFGIWHTTDITKKQPERVYILEEKPTTQYPATFLNAQQDAYMDTEGRIHVIYRIQGESTNGAWISRHAIISPEGEVINDIPVPEEAGEFSRIFQDQQGQFFLLGSSGLLYPMGSDGTDMKKPIRLNLEGNQVEYSGFGISVPRTGTSLSNVVAVVFPSANGTKWLYFQLDFSGR